MILDCVPLLALAAPNTTRNLGIARFKFPVQTCLHKPNEGSIDDLNGVHSVIMASIIPFSEPPYLAGLPSAYYTVSHLKWQKACRAWLDEHFIQHCMDWEREERVPEDVFRRFAATNMLLPSLPAPLPVEWLKKLGIHDILGVVKVEEWDYLHTAIYCDEVFSDEEAS